MLPRTTRKLWVEQACGRKYIHKRVYHHVPDTELSLGAIKMRWMRPCPPGASSPEQRADRDADSVSAWSQAEGAPARKGLRLHLEGPVPPWRSRRRISERSEDKSPMEAGTMPLDQTGPLRVFSPVP